MLTIQLVYKDGTVWNAGGFPDQESVDAWIAAVKAQSNWVSDTEIRVTPEPQAQPSNP